MVRPLKPFIRGGGYYPSSRWTPLVYPGGYTTANGGGQPEPEAVLKTVTGSLIHITDALALPAEALTVNVEPIQDLHGYDSPWPAGGGKNLFSLDLATLSTGAYGLTITRSGDTITVSGTVTTTGNLNFAVTTTYANADLSGKGYVCQVFNWTGTHQFSSCWGFRTESEKSFAISIRNVTAGESVNVSFKISVSATSQTEWSPYSNICPISGRTSATVTRTGANLFDKSTGIQLERNNIRIARSQGHGVPFKLRGGVTYTFSCNSNTPANIYVMQPYSPTAIVSTSGTATSFTYTPQEDIEIGLNFYWDAGRPSDATDVIIEVGSTASAYEPYQGNTYTIQLGETVYGGTLDVTSGKMVVDRAMVDLGTWNWMKGNANNDGTGYIFRHGISDMPLNTNAISSHFKRVVTPSLWEALHLNEFCIPAAYVCVCADYPDASAFKTAVSGVQLVYELATPIEITLTPTQIEMLLGENNLWADAGDSTLTYYADGNASASEALGILLGGTYNNPGGADDVSDDEALGILLGGS